MTISTESSEVVYAGNGLTSTFPFAFPIFAASHLVVTHIASDETETAQVEGTNYTLTWVGPGRTGSVNRIQIILGVPTAFPLPTGESYRIERTVPLTQQVDLVNNSRVRIDQMEKGLDYVTQIGQQIDRRVVDHTTRIVDLEEQTPTGGASEYVYRVSAYGAVGDGVTDDTAAVQAAIAAAPSGATVRFDGSKHYYLRSLGTITKPLTIDGGGCRITCELTPSGTLGSPLFSFSGSYGTVYSCGAMPEGTITLTLTTPADAANFAVGGYVRLRAHDTITMWDGTGDVSAYVYKIEINRIDSIDLGTGVLTLSYPITNGMTTGVEVTPVTMVVQPVVKNFSRITEVDPGASYAGDAYEGPNAPNLVDFYLCQSPHAERIRAYGWALELLSISHCVGGSSEGIHGEDPYYPLVGGVSDGIRINYSRQVVTRNATSLNVRHLVDYTTAIDCASENCVGHCSRADVTTAAFTTHGSLSARIRSINDAATNATGWAIGNEARNIDRQVTIVGFNFFTGAGSNENGIIVTAACEDVQIIAPTIVSLTGGIRIVAGAKRVNVIGGYINTKLAAGKIAIHCYDKGYGIYPFDISIRDVCIEAGDSGIGVYFESGGAVSIEGCRIAAGIPIYGMYAADPDHVAIRSNMLRIPGGTVGGISLGMSGTATPAMSYVVSGNTIEGSYTSAAIRIRGSTLLRCHGNRATDTTLPLLFNSVYVQEILAGGGVVEDNGSEYDIPASPQAHRITGLAGTSRWLEVYSSDRVRMRFGCYLDTESGSSAGSQVQLNVYDDDGVLIDTPLVVNRPTTSSMALQRQQIILGATAIAAGILLQFRGAVGYTKTLQWCTGNSPRWDFRQTAGAESGSNAGSDFECVSRDDAGVVIDTPWNITRASGGQFNVARPLGTTSRRVIKTQSTVSSAGTYSVQNWDHFICITGSTTHTITLPAAAAGRQLFLKNRSTGTVTVNRAGSDTIDGGTTFNLTAGQGTILIANGTDWCRVANA